MTNITLQLESTLIEEVKELVGNKYPFLKINSYAEAVRQVLTEFSKKNQRFKDKNQKSKKQSTETKASI